MTALYPTPRPARRRRSSTRSLGVEAEFFLVDGTTLDAVARSEDVLSYLTRSTSRRERIPIAFHAEMKREQIEVVSPPVRNRNDLVSVIAEGRGMVDQAAMVAGARALPLATLPYACESHYANFPRYRQIAERFTSIARDQLTCGMHVHIAIDSAEEGIGVLNRIRPWLPTLLALSANSPFWQGEDSGFASYRYQAWGRWPTSGPTDMFDSVERYRRETAAAVDAGVSLDERMIYFDARLSSHVPTVEIRIADVCLSSDDAVTLPLLMRALVDRAATDWRANRPPLDWSTTSLRLASWRASRWGLDDQLMHPLMGYLLPAQEAVSALLTHLEGHYDTPAEQDHVEDGVANILNRGNGSVIQRASRAAAGTRVSAVWEALRRGMETPPRS